MRAAVVDVSVSAAWLLPDEATPLTRPPMDIWVPALWRFAPQAARIDRGDE